MHGKKIITWISLPFPGEKYFARLPWNYSRYWLTIRLHLRLVIWIFLLCCLVPVNTRANNLLEIVAFGDSITQGYKNNGHGNQWGITSPPHGARVGGYEPYLEELFAGDSRTGRFTAYVYNWGYGGENTITGVGRLSSILAGTSGRYAFCLLMEGANDLYAGISASTTSFDLGRMVDICRQAKVTPIVSTITKNWNTPAGNLIPEQYNPAIITMAQAKQVILVDQYAMTQQYWSSVFTGDHLHLNDLGDRKMAGVWFGGLLRDDRFRTGFLPAVFLLLHH